MIHSLKEKRQLEKRLEIMAKQVDELNQEMIRVNSLRQEESEQAEEIQKEERNYNSKSKII
jgi:hypothetical protein